MSAENLDAARDRLRAQAAAAPARLIPTPAMDSADRLWAAEDVANYLGLRVGWVYREVREDRLPHIKLGPRRVRFRKEAIDEWLSAHERGNVPPRR